MKIAEFEQYIQDNIDSDLELIQNKNTIDGCHGVVFRGFSLGVTVPPEDVLDYRHPENCDPYGQQYRCFDELIEFIHYKLATNKYAV